MNNQPLAAARKTGGRLPCHSATQPWRTAFLWLGVQVSVASWACLGWGRHCWLQRTTRASECRCRLVHRCRHRYHSAPPAAATAPTGSLCLAFIRSSWGNPVRPHHQPLALAFEAVVRRRPFREGARLQSFLDLKLRRESSRPAAFGGLSAKVAQCPCKSLRGDCWAQISYLTALWPL